MGGHMEEPLRTDVVDQRSDGLVVADVEQPHVEAVRVAQAPGRGAGAGGRRHRVAVVGQAAGEVRADEPAGAGDEHASPAHGSAPDELGNVRATRSARCCSLWADGERCAGSLRISSTTYAGRALISSNIAAR